MTVNNNVNGSKYYTDSWEDPEFLKELDAKVEELSSPARPPRMEAPNRRVTRSYSKTTVSNTQMGQKEEQVTTRQKAVSSKSNATSSMEPKAKVRRTLNEAKTTLTAYFYNKQTRIEREPTTYSEFLLIKISRFQMEQFQDCARCWALLMRKGIGNVGSFPFTINNKVDAVMKEFSDQCRITKQPLPPARKAGMNLVPFSHPDLNKWRNNFQGISIKDGNVLVFGAIDDIWQDPVTKKVYIVDVKATSKEGEISLAGDSYKSYKRQMAIYQWLFRKSGFDVASESYFFFFNAYKGELKGKEFLLYLKASIIPYTPSEELLREIEPTIQRMVRVVKGEEDPFASPTCASCHRVAAVDEYQASLGSQSLPEDYDPLDRSRTDYYKREITRIEKAPRVMAEGTPLKISRAQIEAFLRCEMCWALDAVKGIGRPASFPFTLNNKVDEEMKKVFDYFRELGQPLPIALEEGLEAYPYKHADIDKWRDTSEGVKYLDTERNMLVMGAVDEVWFDPKTKQLIIVDVKATSKKDEVSIDAEAYESNKRQMAIYQWLFRKNGFDVSSTGYFFSLNAYKGDLNEDELVLTFKAKLLAYNTAEDTALMEDANWIENTIDRMHKVFTRQVAPNCSPSCQHCHRVKAVKEYHGSLESQPLLESQS